MKAVPNLSEREVIIVGGGLAGLALADLLHRNGRSFILLEARSRLGGRILCGNVGGAAFDLGPAWYWPGQPRMARMVARLGLTHFDQYAAGEISMENEMGQVQRGQGFASMAGSIRLDGGLQAMIEGLADALPRDAVLMGQAVKKIEKTANGVRVETATGDHFLAGNVVLAVPPRIAATMQFAPELTDETISAMRNVPTWMAGQAKAVAVYDSPFWRDAGLSGDAMSRFGPMVEIHDASPANDVLGALFGFIGVPAQARLDEAVLQNQIKAQLTRLFGDDAARPKTLFLKDWAKDQYTATQQDSAPMYAHPAYGLPPALSRLWEHRLVFGGTEVAQQFGGYLEGALEAAEQAFNVLQKENVAT